MSMSPPDVPAPLTRRDRWSIGTTLVLGYLALLYAVELADQWDRHRLDRYGIRPLETDGLWGILFAPLLHAGWQHLNANAGAVLVLGLVGVLAGLGRFLLATAVIWLLGGFGTWLIGDIGSPWHTVHIGASGLIFGWLLFLIVQGFFSRKPGQVLIGAAVFFCYGAVLWGVLPGQPGVSWQGHLCGALAGVFAAFALSGRSRTA
ncbi:MAG: rhomboid family intramembrane serine protease [Segniliparus sp.]|uniref:rhomboid family intramembrane serine protease n=1 Tax=Segniliparus sp. TaxID=2804064 RepID=UPI003F38AA09